MTGRRASGVTAIGQLDERGRPRRGGRAPPATGGTGARGQQRARAAEDAARRAPGDAHRRHDQRLGAVVRRRRERRRVVAVAARGERVEHRRRDLVAGRAEARRGGRAGAGGDRGVGAVDLLGDAARRPGARSRRVGVGVVGELVPGARELGEQRPPLGVLVEIARRRRRRWRARRGARTAPRSAAGSGAGSRRARPRRRRVREGVDAVVAGDGVEIDGDADDRDLASRLPRYRSMPAMLTTARAPILYRVAMPAPASHEFEVEMHVPALPGRATTSRSSSRPGRPAATWCATSSATSTGLAITDERGRPAARDERARQAALAGRQRRARLPRALPGVRLRGQRAHVVPRRQPRLLERHQPVLLRRGRARRAPAEVDGRAARRARAGASPPRCRRSPGAPPHLRRRRLRRARRLAVRGRRRTRTRAFTVGRHALRAGALRPHQRRPARLVDILRRVVDRDRQDLRRLPVPPLPVHRARAAGRLGRARAPRVGDHGHRRAVVRGRRPATSASPIWPRTSSSTPGTSSASTTPRWGRSTTRARTTRACSGSTRASPTTWPTSSSCAPASPASATSGDASPRTGPSTRAAPGRNETPLAELSFEAWVKQYKPSENFTSTARSATTRRGSGPGMALDLELRLAQRRRGAGCPSCSARLWDRLRPARAGRSSTRDVRDAAAAARAGGGWIASSTATSRHRRAAAAGAAGGARG